MKLSDLEKGQSAVVVKVLGHGSFRKRIMEMGFVRGKRVSVVMNAPLQDPIVYKIVGYEVSLRRSEAAMIEVISEKEALKLVEGRSLTPVSEHLGEYEIADISPTKRINIALVGNPNSGKTSLFNALSGSREHVGNYGGVTVDAKRGGFKYGGYSFDMYDLPGTYSMSSYSPEERYVRKHLIENMPDVIVNVVVASNLERNLYLTTELIDADPSMVIALNMYDELEESGSKLDHETLGAMIGVPMVPTVSRNAKELSELLDTIIHVYEGTDPTVRHIHINYGTELEHYIALLRKELRRDPDGNRHFSSRHLAIKLLERDRDIEEMLRSHAEFTELIRIRDEQVNRLEKVRGEDPETAIADEKYGFIGGALKETYTPNTVEKVNKTKLIDSIVTNKFWGFPIFILIMWLMFESTFRIGGLFVGWIETGVAALGHWISTAMAAGPLNDMIVDGIIGGVGGVIVFLPNILILYLFISFMEDSGYMARAAFIMDKLMHKVGLHGKSFIPLIMGFGCNVPAIMSARTIESRTSRIITILVNPFISCSARLPIYVLFIGAFFPKHASLIMMGLYLFGIVVALVVAKLLRKFMFKKDETPFVMELPPYRMPTGRSTLRHMWDKASQYLRKMGGIILVASIVVWFLSYFPRVETVAPETVAAIEANGVSVVQNEENQPSNSYNTVSYDALLKLEQQKNSYLGRFGRFCEPIVEPLGYNWKACVALLTGIAAKELVVSTLGVLYTDESEEGKSLKTRLTANNPETGKPDFTHASALGFMVFVLLYIPCIAAVVAVGRETGSWKWAVWVLVVNTLIAWLAAWVVFTVANFFI